MYSTTDIHPPFNPSDYVPTESQRVRSVEQSSLCAFEHVPLVDQIVEDGPALRDELIEARIRVVDETMLAESVLFPQGAVHG